MNGFIENLSLTEFCVMYFTLNERFLLELQKLITEKKLMREDCTGYVDRNGN